MGLVDERWSVIFGWRSQALRKLLEAHAEWEEVKLQATALFGEERAEELATEAEDRFSRSPRPDTTAADVFRYVIQRECGKWG